MNTDQPSRARPRRSWFQFSIKALLGSVVFVALACTALLNASEWWASAACTVTLAVLLIAVLASVFRRGPRRAFWLGFAIFGWTYVLLTFWPASDPTFPCQRHVLTTRLSRWAYFGLLPLVRTPPAEPVPMAPFSGRSGGGDSYVRDEFRDRATLVLTPAAPAPPAPPRTYYPDYTPFLTIAEWLWTLLLAMLGGILARYLYATRESER
jgi:drug/metabolite transporter (DMT)-like permease